VGTARPAIPGGYLESGETLAEGAARELHEEAGILLPPEQLQLYMTGTITFINQVYVAFRATVDTDYTDPGVESLACGFFSREECPWEQVAYPEVNDSIVQAYDDLESGHFDVWQAEMTEGRYDFLPVSQFRP
jgi:8-oxo-dGTP pyrophosphatase MutT (NUDIX family)